MGQNNNKILLWNRANIVLNIFRIGPCIAPCGWYTVFKEMVFIGADVPFPDDCKLEWGELSALW